MSQSDKIKSFLKKKAAQIIIVLDLDQIYWISQTYKSRICHDLSVTNPYTTKHENQNLGLLSIHYITLHRGIHGCVRLSFRVMVGRGVDALSPPEGRGAVQPATERASMRCGRAQASGLSEASFPCQHACWRWCDVWNFHLHIFSYHFIFHCVFLTFKSSNKN